MNKSHYHNGGGASQWSTAKFLAVCLLFGLAACSTTRQVEQGVEPSGFLGDYSQLEKGVKNRAVYSYVKPGVNWNQYTQFMIKPIEIWKSDDPNSALGSMSAEDQQTLASLLHTALHNTIVASNYTVVDQPGPGVLIVHAAITDSKKSKPVVGMVSSVYLPLKLIGLGKQAVSGTFFGVGSEVIEGELIDGATNERVAAFVDRRAGTSAIRSKFAGTMGDIQKCNTWWAQRLMTRFAEERDAAK